MLYFVFFFRLFFLLLLIRLFFPSFSLSFLSRTLLLCIIYQNINLFPFFLSIFSLSLLGVYCTIFCLVYYLSSPCIPLYFPLEKSYFYDGGRLGGFSSSLVWLLFNFYYICIYFFFFFFFLPHSLPPKGSFLLIYWSFKM